MADDLAQLQSPPSPEDPQQQAEYFIQLIDAFAQQGTPEAQKIRSGLVELVTRYRDAEDKTAALGEAKQRLAALEVGTAELLLSSTRKIYEKFKQQSRQMGTGSPAGKSIRAAAEGFGKVVEAMETMVDGARKGDEDIKKRAQELLSEAHQRLSSIQNHN